MTNHEKIRKHLHSPSMSFGYVLGKRTRYWPSITTPYRWSGMTNMTVTPTPLAERLRRTSRLSTVSRFRGFRQLWSGCDETDETQNAKRKTQNANATRNTQHATRNTQHAKRMQIANRKTQNAKRKRKTQKPKRNSGQSPNTQNANKIPNTQCGSKPQYAKRKQNTHAGQSPNTQSAYAIRNSQCGSKAQKRKTQSA
jgi:hypothetical protein